jgi:hypothetical protein
LLLGIRYSGLADPFELIISGAKQEQPGFAAMQEFLMINYWIQAAPTGHLVIVILN